VERVLQGELPDLAGRAVVLEFWATWCGPCVANIPHLNELATRFEQQGVLFVSLTEEDAETVTGFLKTHPMKGVIALDAGKKTINRYKAATPTTVLIDRAGRIARKVHPSYVTAAAVEDLALDRAVEIPAIRDDMFPLASGGPIPESTGDNATVLSVKIAPSMEPGGLMEMPNHFKAAGARLPELLSYAYGISEPRMLVSKYFEGGLYSVDAWVPESASESLRPMLITALETALDFDGVVHDRATDVIVLHGMPGKLQVSNAKLPTMQRNKGWMVADGLSADDFYREMETLIGKPVIGEPLTGQKFKWSMQWDDSRAGALESAIRDELGLQFRTEKRNIKMLIVTGRGETH
jgi:uncharacterized protein (TIGR03435 family)